MFSLRTRSPEAIQKVLPFSPGISRVRIGHSSTESHDSLNDGWEDQVQIAKDQDNSAILKLLEPLLVGQDAERRRRWYLCLGGEGIIRPFHFKTFKHTWVG